jgi:hypothetical protein
MLELTLQQTLANPGVSLFEVHMVTSLMKNEFFLLKSCQIAMYHGLVCIRESCCSEHLEHLGTGNCPN